MQIVVNIGNTNIRFGIFHQGEIIKSWIINTKPYKTSDELFINFKNMYLHYGIDNKEIKKIIIGSVVPNLTSSVYEALENLHAISPIVVDRNTTSEVTHQSNQMGTDLYANAVAAHHLYKGNKIIVDFGTALTFTAINPQGKLLGVVIAPGIQTSLNALIGNTAQLSNIEIKKPEKVLGKNTEHCMQSGIVYGFSSMVEGTVERIKNEIDDKNTIVIATGGLSAIFYPISKNIDYQDILHTLKGIEYLGKTVKN
jgi:type III pantothenate kinase